MSPEQAGGEATLDIRSDIYSLGATLFTLVTGRKPFEGNGPFAIAAKVLTQTVPDPRSVNPQVAPAVAELIQRAMAKAPDERFQTPLALRTQALAVLDSLGQRSASTSSHRAAGPAGAISGVTPTTGPTTIPTQKLRTALKRLRSSAASESAWPRILLSALVVVVAAGFGWMVLTHGMAATAAPREHVRTPPSAPPLIAAPPAPVAPPAAKPVPPSPPAEPASPVPPPIAAWPAPPNAVAPAARWAQGHGTDAYGSWADLAIGSQIQRFRWIPPGSFTYGSPKSEVGHEEMWEKQRPVTFSRGFWLADSPCTQAVYQELTGLTPARYRGDAQLPVTNVSMADAEACAGALARRYPGTVFRLPTRCEWQYACRAGTTTVYFFGDDPHGIVAYGQVADPSTWPVPGMPEAPRGPRSDEHPVPVRHFKPNPWGLYDMLGNVCVWCYGRFKLPDGALVDPEADDVADERMGHIRGGNYWSSPKSFRAAEGGYISPEGRNDDIGFRLVILGDVPSPAGAKDVAPGH
jgi:formylglycine-generating enzyme required for sulfatase activity